MNFLSQIGYSILKNNQNRCPICNSEVFVYFEIKDYRTKMGKYQDFDLFLEEQAKSLQNKTLMRFSAGSIESSEINPLSETRTRAQIQNFNKNSKIHILHKINRKSIYKDISFIHCTKCFWYKYVYQKYHNAPI